MNTISVVIPTIGRPELKRAVVSALNQAMPPKEVLVVADTVAPIDLPDHPSVKLLRVGPGAGGNVARQAGIEAAGSELVALLDDDDEWLECHLSNLAAVVPADGDTDRWIASSRLYARGANGKSRTWPQRLMNDSESLPQYIFRKKAIIGGVGFIQASTLLFPRQLAIDIPFDASLKFHQDVSWLVDLSKSVRPIAVYQSEQPSVIYHIGAATVSRKITAPQSRAWASRLDPADTRTIGDFIVVHSIQGARNTGSLHEIVVTISAGLKMGRPGVYALLYAFALLAQASIFRILRRKK